MMEGREPDEATDDPWHCAGCNAPAKGKKKPCDCVTNVGVRTGPNGYREQTWWDDPPAADTRWVAIDEKGNDNFATSIYENDYDGLLVARCNQNGNHPWQAAAILRGLERNRQATPPAASDLRERAQKVVSDFCGYMAGDEWHPLIDDIAAEFAAIRAEAKAEGWEDAVKALLDPSEGLFAATRHCEPFMPDDRGRVWRPGQIVASTVMRAAANWLAANRPTGREGE